LDRTRKPAVSEVSRTPEQLLEEQRILAGTLDALRGKRPGIDKTACDGQRVDRGERREIDGDQGCAAGQSAPMGFQRIAFEPGCHRQKAAARGRRAGDRRKKAERLGVGPMDVLDRDQQRLAIGRSLHQFDDDALLALRPGRRIHRFVQSARRLRLGNLEQIAQIELVIGVQHQLPHGRLDRTFDNVGRRARAQADKPRHDCADSAVSAFSPEIENEARMARHAQHRGG
jgi:hypothetical protein